MKLRNREPSSTVRDAGTARGDDGGLSAPTPRSRPSRRASIAASASRATPRATPRSAPRTAPRGGVQKRKVNRPTVRQRSDTTTTTTTARARRVAAVAAADHLVQAKTRSQARAAIREPVVKEGMEEDVVDAEEVADVADDKPKTTIDDLPEEVMLGIFSYFRPPQLCWKIGRVCRRWASWSVSSILWKDKEYTLSPDPNLSSKKK